MQHLQSAGLFGGQSWSLFNLDALNSLLRECSVDDARYYQWYHPGVPSVLRFRPDVRTGCLAVDLPSSLISCSTRARPLVDQQASVHASKQETFCS